MAFKPGNTKSDINKLNQTSEFNHEKFIEDIFNDNYILVIGSEVILNTNLEPSGDVKKYILSVVNHEFKRNYSDYNELARDAGEIDYIRSLLSSDSFSFDIDDMSPELIDFIKPKLFNIVLTTTFDNYIETLMKKIWGEENLKIVNIYDKNSLIKLESELELIRDIGKYKTPVLFYVFGKAVKDETKRYVRSDDDAILVIEDWIKLKNVYPRIWKLLDRQILALGCKFDDWYFRFFWYILKGEVSKFRQGQVAFSIDEDNVIEQRLATFLQRKKIYRHSSARLFMKDFIKNIVNAREGSPYSNIVKSKRQQGGIFISYSSNDFVLANRLFFRLTNMGYNVWLDYAKLYGGQNYNSEIETAIARTKVFLPLLTPNIAEDLKNKNLNRYYVKEWKMTRPFDDIICIPIAMNGYDLKHTYHHVFEHLINATPSGIDLMNKDGFNLLKYTLDKYL